jgi:hypothetical protein
MGSCSGGTFDMAGGLHRSGSFADRERRICERYRAYPAIVLGFNGGIAAPPADAFLLDSHEIFTGRTDAFVSPNLAINNKNVNVLEYLNASKEYHGKVAVFTSWNVFPYILNEVRSGLPVNSGYQKLNEEGDPAADIIDSVESNMRPSKTRHDLLTFWARGSGDIWLAILGPGIVPEGELKSSGQVYQRQLAATMAALLGDPVAPGHPPGKAIRLPSLPAPTVQVFRTVARLPAGR